MKRAKRFLSIFLSICLLLGILPSTALASGDKTTADSIQIGDFLTFGTFNNHPMLWQVVDNSNGKLKIFSTDILFNGPIDAEINMHGNASVMEGETNWHTSDIRQYLNSNDSTVSYKGELPNYGNLPGFLTNFTSDEAALIQDTTHKSLVHYSTSGVEKDGGTKYARDTFFNGTSFDIDAYNELAYVNVTEKVFLPDMMDLRELRDNGLSYTRYAYSEYSDSFVETADSGFFTRTPVYSVISAFSTTYYYGVYYVHTWFGTSTAEAERGIRPMCYIQLDNEQTITGSGTLESPYVLEFGSDDAGDPDELQLISCSPDNRGTFTGNELVVSMTFNHEIESVQTGISFDENNNTVIHGDFSIVRQIEEADGWEFETVYSLSEGNNVETDVTIDGSTVMINASDSELILGETYYVLMDNGVIAFKDTDEQIGFGGTEWTFTVSGAKTGSFCYKAQYGITEYPYTYDDSWFLESSTEYNHDLAKMSLRAAIAAYGSGSNADGSEYIQNLMVDELGFHNLDVYYPDPQRNSIGYAIGSKTISSNDNENSTQSLILVAIRGGEYGAEWGGNFTIGTGELADGITGDLHEGFSRAAEQVEDGLASYIRWNHKEGNLSENCVVWVVGYSRAAATANLLAKRLDDGSITGLGTNNVFAYCFECPQNSRALNLSNSKYDNIMNIVNPLDFVTMVAMDDWDYGRYGQTFYLPYEEGVVNYNSLKYEMLQQYISIIQAGSTGGNAFTATEQVTGQRDMTEGAMNWLADEFSSAEVYTALYQEALVECIEAFINKEWKPVSNTASAIVVLGKLGLIAKGAVSLPDNPYDLVDKISGIEDDLNAVMALELLLFSASDRGSLTKTPITYSHYPELCLAWMDALEGNEIVCIDDNYRKVFINCPVDVSVYSSNNILVGRVVGRTIQDIENGVSIYIDEDDQIVISLPITEEYRIGMEATGEGTVTYTVTEHNIETSSSERVVSYPLIEVKTGDILIGSIENLNEVEIAEYNLTYNGTEQSATIEQSGDDVVKYAVTVNVEGDGSVAYNGKAVYGEYRKMTATPDDGAEFIGWFINGELVSAENEYRFCVTSDITVTAKFTSLNSDDDGETTIYTVTYTDGVDGEEVFADQTFNVEEGSATPAFIGTPIRSGYTFIGWAPTVSSTVTGNQTYTATWQKDSTGGGIVIPTVFAVNVTDSDNGEVKASAKYADPGSTIKLTVTPDEGYELEALTVKSGSKIIDVTEKNGKYQFIMPFGSVTVTATFTKIEAPVVPSFDDVAENAYYFDAVEWAVKNGITTGTSDTTFSPDMTCTRAQAVTFLWRATGSPEPKSNVMPFEDVAAEAYYYKAVLWAVENGITNGTSATTFSPDAECTRAQIVTFLWRSQKSPAITAVNPFADVAADAYYFDAVLWAVDEKITNGTSSTTFSPDTDCTRAQIVTFLYRCLGDK